ncbi:MAG: FAD-dependent oxidoreductase [Deltaproteobacteria bacterium]|nr:FAD-dependent oxidoreductase [Deltaproteobacteria bacterium]
MQIVIVGNGVAGMEAALVVRARMPEAEITIVSEESEHFFSRTALMWVVCGQLDYPDIEPLERDVYARQRFRRVRARAVGLDAEARTLKLVGDLPDLPFDSLLIACGSRPRPGPWPGSTLGGVGHFVTMQDLEWLEAELHGGPAKAGPPNSGGHLAHTTEDSPYLPRTVSAVARGASSRRPCVVGGGLIGIEAVEVMHAAGLRPRFFIREEWFWPIAMDSKESTWIAERMREHGVDVQLEEGLECFEADDAGNVVAVKSDRGERYEVDLAVIAIGVVPNTDWLKGSAVKLDAGGGIVVDEGLESSVPGVFAAGDCASVRWFEGSRRPEQLWYTGREQGRIAGKRLMGDAALYARGAWYNSAKLFDIEYTTVGLVNMNLEGEQNFYFEERGSVRSTNRVVVADGRVVGFNFLGRRWDHEVLLRFIAERRSLEYTLEHLHEAAFDTEFVPALSIPPEARRAPLSGPAPSGVREPITPPTSAASRVASQGAR